MARLRTPPPVNADRVPVELTDPGHPVWRSGRKTIEWCARHAVAVPRRHLERLWPSDDWPRPARLADHLARTRWHRCAVAWAKSAGLVREDRPLLPDWGALAEVGIGAEH